MSRLADVEMRVALAAQECLGSAEEYTLFVAQNLFLEQVATWRRPGRPRVAGLQVHLDRTLEDNQIRLRHEVIA